MSERTILPIKMKKQLFWFLGFFCFAVHGQKDVFDRTILSEEELVPSIEFQKAFNKGKLNYFDLSVNRGLGHAYYVHSEYTLSVKHYNEFLKENEHHQLIPEEMLEFSHALKSTGLLRESDQWMAAYYTALGESVPSTSASETLNQINNTFPNVTLSEASGFSSGIFFPTDVLSQGEQLLVTTATSVDEQLTRNQRFTAIMLLDLQSDELFNVGENINTGFNESDAVVTKDGNTMYYSRNEIPSARRLKKERRPNGVLIYEARKKDSIWQEVGPVTFNFYGAFNGHPALSPKEDYLYFTSNADGLGKTDLYRVRRYENGTFGTPFKLGSEINSPSNEGFPQVTDDALYFSSQGHDNIGGMDILRSDISGDGFSKPVNMGGVINSHKDDYAFIVNTFNNKAYFSSNRSGKEVIYSFDLKDLEQTPAEHVVTTLAVEPSTTEIKAEPMKPVDAGQQLLAFAEVGPIYFGLNSSYVTDYSKVKLDKIIEKLKDHELVKVQINAHADTRASQDYNQKLSDLRGHNVKAYFVENGISADRISIAALGESIPVNRCVEGVDCPDKEHIFNRRVEFVFSIH